MLGWRDWLVVLLLVLLLFDCCGALLVVGCTVFAAPEQAHAVEFRPRPKDRPVLESVQQVWEARTTGVSRFHCGGVYYVVEDLPKHYIDYSSWYVRMP